MSIALATLDSKPNATKLELSLWLVGAGALLLSGAVAEILAKGAFTRDVPIAVAPVVVESARPAHDGGIDHAVVRDLPLESDNDPGRSVAAYDR
jgi:hypothetical protein